MPDPVSPQTITHYNRINQSVKNLGLDNNTYEYVKASPIINSDSYRSDGKYGDFWKRADKIDKTSFKITMSQEQNKGMNGKKKEEDTSSKYF